MRKARVSVHGNAAGVLEELDPRHYRFIYEQDYQGPPVSLSMPIHQRMYEFDSFPPFFDGLLPEGFQLEALLKQHKIDRHDYFTQLTTVGRDLVGAVTVEEIA
jgi:serine/threonine-protein kinase HipA